MHVRSRWSPSDPDDSTTYPTTSGAAVVRGTERCRQSASGAAGDGPRPAAFLPYP